MNHRKGGFDSSSLPSLSVLASTTKQLHLHYRSIILLPCLPLDPLLIVLAIPCEHPSHVPLHPYSRLDLKQRIIHRLASVLKLALNLLAKLEKHVHSYVELDPPLFLPFVQHCVYHLVLLHFDDVPPVQVEVVELS